MLLAGPDDVTWAVEWSFTLQPGDSAVILSDTRLDSYPQPVISPIPDRTVSVGELIRFTNHASGSYPPYGFSLGTGFAQQGPTGASVNPTNGIFQWRPAANQAGTTNLIKVVCDDGYMPVGWSTQQFTVVVRDYVQVTAGSTAVGAGETGCIPLTIACSAALTKIAFDICASASSVAGLTVSPTGSVAGAQINQSSPGVWHVNLTTNPGQFLQGTQMMAVLQLTTVSNQPSSLIPVGFSNIAPAAGKGPMLSDIAGLAGQLAIVNGAPLLTGSPGGHGVVNFILYGDTSAHYAIQSISQLIPPWIWTDCTQVNLSSRVTNLSVAVPGQYNFYRARKF